MADSDTGEGEAEKKGYLKGLVLCFLFLPIALASLHLTFSQHLFCYWVICQMLESQDKGMKSLT